MAPSPIWDASASSSVFTYACHEIYSPRVSRGNSSLCPALFAVGELAGELAGGRGGVAAGHVQVGNVR